MSHLSPIKLSAKAKRTVEQPISFLMAAAVQNPDIISFAAGLVDQQSLPTDIVAKHIRKLMDDKKVGQRVLQYGTTHGDLILRQLVLDHITKLDDTTPDALKLTRDSVVVTTGSQQALYLLAEVLIDPGDIVIAADPCYFVYTGTLASFGAQIRAVPTDDDGMIVEKVDALLAEIEKQGQLHRVKMVYVVDYYQNPTGLTLSAQRRPRLLEIVRKWSKDHRILILEDAAYRELWYDAPPPRTIKSFDTDNQFVAASFTFSKPLSPGLKTGYTILPDDLVDPVLQQKGNHDFGSANLCQQLARSMLETGDYHVHVQELRDAYRIKRDAMLDALDKHMPKDGQTHWTHPGGGLYVWLTLPEHINTSRPGKLFDECVRQGVMYVPGAYCHQPIDGKAIPQNHMRLSFGHVSVERIEPGIQRLAQALNARA